jgi:hypothetical protein
MAAAASLPTSAAIPTAIASFLTQLAVTLHKLRAYPEGHPLRRDAVESGFAMLDRVLTDRETLRIGVARRQLIVDEIPTDAAHFVIRDLARRLHKAGLGAIAFERGVELGGFGAALERLAAEPPRGKPAAEATPTSDIPHIDFSPIAYDALLLDDQGDVDGTHVDQLWQELAHIVGTGVPLSDGGSIGAGPVAPGSELPGSEVLAQALLDRIGTPQARAALASTIERLGLAARTLEGDERHAVEVRLGHLLNALPKNALGVLLDFDVKRPETLTTVAQAADWLPVTALLEVVENAARAQHQEVSTLLLRLLRKLGGVGGASMAPTVRSDTDFRSIVKGLLSEWTLGDPNPATHTRILDYLSRHDVPAGAEGAPTSEGLRILQMALETEAFGDQVVEGIELVLEAGQLGPLVELLELASTENRAAVAVWRNLAAPATIARLLKDPGADLTPLGKIVRRADGDVVPVLIDGLFGTTDATRRREIMVILARLGSDVPLEILKRVERVAVSERRGFLALLAELPELPAGFTARAYAESPEPMIRLEAFRLMLRNPDDRTDAIFAALADADERVIRVAVDAALEHLPRGALTRLMLLLNNAKRSPELRARAIPILGQFDMPSIRQWLLDGMVVRRGWLRRARLSPKSPVLLAKLRLLSARWLRHPDVSVVRRLAEKSGDPELVAAVGEEAAA